MAGFLNLFVIVSLTIFLPAGSLDNWQAWSYLATFFVPVLAITLHLLMKDPELIQRRLKVGPTSERRPQRKVIQGLASLVILVMYILPGLDHRVHWSTVPVGLVIASDIAVIAGMYVVFVVFRENRHASSLVEVAGSQTVISTGPYARVRHPMYSGALLLILPTPLALGSWWGLPCSALLTAAVIVRLLDEEKFLTENLAGYALYCEKVRCRLVPRVWYA